MKRPATTSLPMHRHARALEAAKAMRSVEAAIEFAKAAHAAARAAERASGAWVDHADRARLAAILVDLRASRRELLRIAAKGWRR
jgi:hypothetical protein